MPRKKKPKRPPRTPKYRLHRKSGRAFVEPNGRRVYLGDYESAETRQKYHAVIAEWEANSRTLPVPPDEITVVELLARFWEHAKGYYKKLDGTPTSELDAYDRLIRLVRKHYGRSKATEFGPRALKALRQTMVRRGICRKSINKDVGRIRNIFRWGAAEELIPPSVHQALQAVANLKFGRSEARESQKVPPVPEPHIEAVKPFVSRQVWAMIQLQICTGARPGDVIQLRLVDIDMSEAVWCYRPQTHKTEHHGHERVIYIGPDAKEVLGEFMSQPVSAYVFSPKEAEMERLLARHASRTTPLSCGNRPGTNRKKKPECKPGERYTTASYRRAIQRACDRAGVPRWHPHQLRHNAATRLRKAFGVEAAKIVLGVRSIDMAELYAERDQRQAMAIAERMG